MVECEYCGAAFDDKEAHLEHLGEEHAEELGAIDRRRVEAATDDEDGGLPVAGLLSGVAVLVVLVVAIWFFFLSGPSGVEGVDAEPTGMEDDPLQDSGAEEWISQVETFESNGAEHRSGDIDYERIPPLSGTHSRDWASAGFYTETQRMEELVHSLEHGAVVIYYDEAALNDSAEASLRAWANNKDGSWQSIIVVPNPNDDPRGDYVLTAWTHRLTLDSYNAEAVYAFASEYLGRGPENPVR
ncbi:DUF3105 domain-containing protein [Halolamina salifodinae]|uniref:C2H2-type domain-containing protein n=1 Tax=Halolamina salifodinae TaxID=1202767 RepID=A0A8T4GVQ9_9EURY|nr:DUF3105 domain-containing protein [Halolamina salifodinae]MBP1986192.1 hypothetical protein [Halolamina salifodinae]